jgi:hypothetical protein
MSWRRFRPGRHVREFVAGLVHRHLLERPDDAARDRHNQGWNGCLARLETHLFQEPVELPA